MPCYDPQSKSDDEINEERINQLRKQNDALTQLLCVATEHYIDITKVTHQSLYHWIVEHKKWDEKRKKEGK